MTTLLLTSSSLRASVLALGTCSCPRFCFGDTHHTLTRVILPFRVYRRKYSCRGAFASL